MSDQVIRHDVIKLEFESDALDELRQIRKEFDELKRKLTGGVGDEEMDDLGEKTKKARKEIDQTNTSAGKLKSTLKGIARVSFKALLGGLGATATATGILVKQSVAAYAEFEQLKGGVDTLFGPKGTKSIEEYAKLVGKSTKDVKKEYDSMVKAQDLVLKNANNAWKTSGLSANDYMQTVTTFSAALIQSVNGDTKKAAGLADTAMQDMADNANKMGTDMQMIQNAYSGFARGQWMMLDNLKLGYAGSKSEMERLLKDAEKISGVKYDVSSYADIVNAIHVIQENMGITGTTAKEAMFTITGSANAFKAAWGNMLPALIQGGDAFDQCLNNLIESIIGVENESGKLEGGLVNNLAPAIQKALGGVGTLIEKLSPMIAKGFPKAIDMLLPPLLDAATALLKAFIIALPDIVDTIIKEMPGILKQLGQAIGEAFGIDTSGLDRIGDFFAKHGETIKKAIPIIAGLAGAFMLFSKVQSFGSGIASLFGKSGGGAGGGGLFGGIAELGKTNTGMILKGMANIAIIVGGFTVLGAAFAKAAPYIAQLSDLKSLGEVAAIVTVLGFIGSTLTKFAATAGAIPVMTVVKGLANMAIMIGGMTAIGAAFALVSPYIAKLANTKELLKVAAIVTVLGIVGGVLAVFAGIVGTIPIPVVLTGLANIALVLGGFTAVAAAFGALTKIDGFTELISTGGQVLIKLCDILGQMVGSLVGGAISKVSESLPTIGKNIAGFAKNIKPMFTMFEGVDMTGAGQFFSALGSFMLKMSGEKILSFFSGGPDFEAVANGLKSLATDGVKKFFAMVNSIEESAFSKAGQFFTALDGISKLPNVGGIAQIFSGENDFSGVATGLATLNTDGVKGFFAMVAGLKEQAFTNAKSFFNALDGISALPNVGGIGQVFSGENDFEGVASGLKALSGEGVKNFFAMVTKLDDGVFAKTTKLFQTLAGINNVGKKGFWESVKGLFSGGDEESPLSSIAKGLGDFSSKAETFFKQINSLKIENLTGLADGLNAVGSAAQTLQETVSGSFDGIVNAVKAGSDTTIQTITNMKTQITTLITTTNLAPGGANMMNTLLMGINSRKASVISAISSIVSDINSKINKVISGGNWALEQFGSDTRLQAYEYARGTGGHPGGNAIVNDGRGAELVQMPNGKTFIPSGRDVFMPNAPRGMKVLDAQNTARLFGKHSPTFRYADGTENVDVFSFEKGANLVNALVNKFVDFGGSKGFALHGGKAAVEKIKSSIGGWGDKLINEFGVAGLGDYVASAGVAQWKSTVARALRMEGQYSEANLKRTLFQMQTESGGNPYAINKWDSNAKKGTPSKGLLQVIDPTFKAYAREGYNTNSYDPLSNILASIRYAVSRYGSLAKAYQGHGYSSGVGERSIELPQYTPTSSISSSNSTENNTYAPTFNLTISGSHSDREMERKVKRWINEAMGETFRSMARRNPRLQEC